MLRKAMLLTLAFSIAFAPAVFETGSPKCRHCGVPSQESDCCTKMKPGDAGMSCCRGTTASLRSAAAVPSPALFVFIVNQRDRTAAELSHSPFVYKLFSANAHFPSTVFLLCSFSHAPPLSDRS